MLELRVESFFQYSFSKKLNAHWLWGEKTTKKNGKHENWLQRGEKWEKIHLKMPTSLKCRRDEPAFLETQFRMRNYSFTLTPCWSFTHINNVHFFIPQLFPRLCCFVSLCMQLQFELSVYSEFWFRAALGVLYIVTRWKLLVLSSSFSLSFHNFFLICNVEILRDDIVVERDEMPSYAS